VADELVEQLIIESATAIAPMVGTDVVRDHHPKETYAYFSACAGHATVAEGGSAPPAHPNCRCQLKAIV
jgi:hypothetical protein